MKIKVLNTAHGMIPLYDEDYDEKKKLKLDTVYEGDFKEPRNLKFHNLFMAFLRKVWDYQPEYVEQHYKTFEGFRATVLITAGHCDTVYNLRLGEFCEVPKSLSFGAMDEMEFKTLFERVKDVCFRVYLQKLTKAEYERDFANFNL